MDIQETRFFQASPVSAGQPAAAAAPASPLEGPPLVEELIERREADRRVTDVAVPVDQRVSDRRSADSAAQVLTAQGGLALTPSPAQAAVQSIGHGATQEPSTPPLFIDAESRPEASTEATPDKSIASLNVAAPMGRPGEPGKGAEKGSEKGSEKGREKGSEKGSEKGREKGEEKGREKGSEKGSEKGREKGSEKGREKGSEKGSEKGHEKGSEKGSEKSHEKGSEKSHEKSDEKGSEKSHEKSGEKGSEKSHEKSAEKSHEKGAEKPGEHPQGPRPPAPPPPHHDPPPAPTRPSAPKAPPTHTVHDGGHDFNVPTGGWVTKAHHDHPDLKTSVIDRNHDWRNQITDVRHWHDGDVGSDWYRHPHGFYSGDDFWYGFDVGQADGWDFDTDPVYVVSPVTGDDSGVITPPDGGFGNDPNAVYEQLLDILANPSQDPNDPNFDKTAGVYLDTKDFDPTHPGKQLSGQDAWTALSSGKPLYFHPPNGDWETIQSVDDLNAYLYTQEQQQTPDDPSGPPQSNGLLLLDPTRAPLQVGDGMGTNEPNDDVRTLQQRLSVCGFNVGQPDGQFGPGTERAVRSFQSAHRLPVTGLADAATLDAVNQVSNIDMEAGQVINDAQTLVSDDLNTRPVSKRTPEQKARLRQEALTDVADSRQFLGDYDKTTDNLRRDGVAKAAFPIARNGVAAADANQPHK